MGTLFGITLVLNLSLGAIGPQVVALQQILNRDVDTRITTIGPGSPGNETNYFGLLTKNAVIRFQQKYANEVLTPAGLFKGSGYVGLYTRAKLNALSVVPVVTENIPVQSAPIAPTSPMTATNGTATTPQNPNLKNLDKFLAAIDQAKSTQDFSAAKRSLIKEQIVKAVATTTDLRTTFIKLVEEKSGRTVSSDTFIGTTLAALRDALGMIFAPAHARAAVGIPFGGALFYSFYCWNSNTWLLTIQPLPPTFVTLLSYVPGSQAFLSYNIPATHWLLGEYSPVGVCVFACPFCIIIPTEGTITPVVGSSPV